MLIRVLTGLVNGSDHTKWVSLRHQKCITQPILINLHPNEFSQELHYYPLAVKLDRCVRNHNGLNELNIYLCVQTRQNI